MRWEELTSDQFPQAVQTAQGVCLLPPSVIERHAHHLPMGTDMIRAVKEDQVTQRLQDEFFAASEQPTPSDKRPLPG